MEVKQVGTDSLAWILVYFQGASGWGWTYLGLSTVIDTCLKNITDGIKTAPCDRRIWDVLVE